MTGQIKNFNFLKKYKNFVCIVCFVFLKMILNFLFIGFFKKNMADAKKTFMDNQIT